MMTDQSRPIGALLEASGFREIVRPKCIFYESAPYADGLRMWEKDVGGDVLSVEFGVDELIWVVTRECVGGDDIIPDGSTSCYQIVSEEAALLVAGIIPSPNMGEFTSWQPTAHDLAAAAARQSVV